ncbi:WD40-repeat-containing domain protein [Hysterangium stoloniferum]|nr:WD40-repeat-containing domain protein [Hysterangium stoloniferum]
MSAPESLRLPSSVTAAAFSYSGHLGVAGDDGTLRVYEAPYKKVWKAARNLGSEVSSLVFVEGGGKVDSVPVWLACGQNVLCFELGSASKMILVENDALTKIRITEEDDDVLNEIATNGSHLAYSLDSGVIGVIDLKSREKIVMKALHSNLCTNVSFIPDRPRELISGGYDFTLLHFDFPLGKFLSSLKFEGPSEPSAQVSLSPPFIQSLDISSNGLVACGLADGRIWLGSGGERIPIPSSERSTSASKKKRRKWDGLNPDAGNYTQIAEGPIIGIAFASGNRVFTLTLLGTLTMHKIENGRVSEKFWTSESPGLFKANSLAVNGTHIAVGGIDSEGKGVLLIWPSERLEGSLISPPPLDT